MAHGDHAAAAREPPEELPVAGGRVAVGVGEEHRCALAAEILDAMPELVQPGVTTASIDDAVRGMMEGTGVDAGRGGE